MKQSRPRRVVTRPVSTRPPPNNRKKYNPNPSYAYSPRTTRKTNANYNSSTQAKNQYSPYLSAYKSNKKSQDTRKPQENVNWISSLNNITFSTQNKPANSNLSVPASASLLFPSPSSPITRTPGILRKLIDDSGMKILRESPLSARDSYYAKDIDEQISCENQVKFSQQISRPFSIQHGNMNNNETPNKTFIANTPKSERQQRSEQKISFKLDNLNTDPNLDPTTQNLSTNDPKSNESDETKNQEEKKVDLEKLFDLSDFNLDKYDASKLDTNNEAETVNGNTELTDEPVNNSESPNADINAQKDENKTTDIKPTIKPPVEKADNRARFIDYTRTGLNQTAKPNTDSNSDEYDDDSHDLQFESQKSPLNNQDAAETTNLPKTAISHSKLQTTETGQTFTNEGNTYSSCSTISEENSDDLFDDESEFSNENQLFDESVFHDPRDESDSEMTVNDKETPFFIDIFGDMTNFLYPGKNRNPTDKMLQNSSENYKNRGELSPFSSYSKENKPLRSSFKKNEECSSQSSGRKSVKFILPEE